MDGKNVYILTGESYMVRRSFDALRLRLDVAFPEVNEMVYKSMPKTDALIEACASMPMMAEKRIVAVMDCTILYAKGSAEDAKVLAAYLDRIPESTVLVLCSDASPDKRRALYKRVKEIGRVIAFAAPKPAECAGFAIAQAKTHGAVLPRAAASVLVDIVGCSYYALDNETQKLAVYCGGREITKRDVLACAARSLEYNVFEIHGLFVNKKGKQARALLADIMGAERPEALIGLFARKIRDMYKVKAMLDVRYSSQKIAAQLKLKPFVVDILVRECRGFSLQELRRALTVLADLDYAIKCGEADAALALPQTLVDIYML